MQLSAAQFQQIDDLLPRQCGNVKVSNLQVFNPMLFVAAYGCKWQALLMDRAYQDVATRELARRPSWRSVLPPNPQRRQPWAYERQIYRYCNQSERRFRHLKAWRHVFTRYVKLV